MAGSSPNDGLMRGTGAVALNARALDTSIEIVTPENIAFGYRVAGPFRRLPAYLIDVLIRASTVAVITLVAMMFFSLAGLWGFGLGVVLVAWFLLDWFYGGLFEALWNGQTPGKRLFGLRVLTVTGQPISGWQAILRNFLRFVDAWPLVGPTNDVALPTYFLALVSMTLTQRFQRLGDLAAGTMVVVEEPQRHYGMAQVTEPEAIQLAASLPARLQISRGLARALSSYVQRRQVFPWARRVEIAMHVGEPLRVRYGLPQGTSHDLLLCALYYRAFIADRPDDDPRTREPVLTIIGDAPVEAELGVR